MAMQFLFVLMQAVPQFSHTDKSLIVWQVRIYPHFLPSNQESFCVPLGVIQHFIYSQNHSIHVKFNKAPASNKVTYIPSDSLIPEPFMLPLSRTNEKRQASTVQSRPVFPQTADRKSVV